MAVNNYQRMSTIMVNREASPAVDFELPATDGRIHRLQDYRGQWLLLMFHRHLA